MASPAGDVDRLRKKIEQGWASIDDSSHPNPDSSSGNAADDFGFDEGSELEKLSRQLNLQTDMNNDLLNQVIQLETESQQTQKEVQEKQQQLRKALNMVDQMRSENVELKRKQQSATETLKSAQDELAKTKSELDKQKRAMEGQNQAVNQHKLESDARSQEMEELRKEVERAQREEQEWRRQLELLQQEEQVRDAERRADVDSSQREVQQFKQRMGPLEAELKAEKQRTQELQRDLQTRTDEYKQTQAQLHDVKQKFQHFKDKADRAVANEEDLLEDLDAKRKQLVSAEQNLSAASELVSALETDLKDAQRVNKELMAQNRELEMDAKDLKQQLDLLANDLQVQAAGRRQDRERLEAKNAQLQREAQEATLEARTIGTSLSQQVQSREEEFAEQRRVLEEGKNRLQNETARLNELLLNVQRELGQVRNEFQDERDQYEHRLMESLKQQRSMEAKLQKSDLLVSEEANTWKERLLDAQAQLNARTRLHVDTLGALETAMLSVVKECHRLEASEEVLREEVELLRQKSKEHFTKTSESMQGLAEETRRSLTLLAENCEMAELEAQDARNCQLEAEAQRDEEQGKTLVLGEERHRLEEECRQLEDSVKQLDAKLKEKLRMAKSETDTVVQSRRELEALSKRTQDQLDRANVQTQRYQEDLERVNVVNAEMQQKLRDKIAALEDRLASFEKQSNEADNSRDQAMAEYNLMKKCMETQKEENARLQQEIAQLEESRRGSGVKEFKEESEAKKHLAMLKESMRKQSVQFSQTKTLLQVLQEQKKQWTEEKQALKAELEDYRQLQQEQTMLQLGE